MTTDKATIQDYQEAILGMLADLSDVRVRDDDPDPIEVAILNLFENPRSLRVALDTRILDHETYASSLHHIIWHDGWNHDDVWSKLPAEIKRKIAPGSEKYCCADLCKADEDSAVLTIFNSAESAQICFEVSYEHREFSLAWMILRNDAKAWINTYMVSPMCPDVVARKMEEDLDADSKLIEPLLRHRKIERHKVGEILSRTLLVACARPLAARDASLEREPDSRDRLDAIAAVARDSALMCYIARLAIGIRGVEPPLMRAEW